MKPVTLADGSLHNFTVKVGGKPFRCSCGCNVFHKPDETRQHIYQCNACESWYSGDDGEKGTA